MTLVFFVCVLRERWGAQERVHAGGRAGRKASGGCDEFPCNLAWQEAERRLLTAPTRPWNGSPRREVKLTYECDDARPQEPPPHQQKRASERTSILFSANDRRVNCRRLRIEPRPALGWHDAFRCVLGFRPWTSRQQMEPRPLYLLLLMKWSRKYIK